MVMRCSPANRRRGDAGVGRGGAGAVAGLVHTSLKPMTSMSFGPITAMAGGGGLGVRAGGGVGVGHEFAANFVEVHLAELLRDRPGPAGRRRPSSSASNRPPASLAVILDHLRDQVFRVAGPSQSADRGTLRSGRAVLTTRPPKRRRDTASRQPGVIRQISGPVPGRSPSFTCTICIVARPEN